jgi:hypothetical protein
MRRLLEWMALTTERYRCNICGCDYYEDKLTCHIHKEDGIGNFDSFVLAGAFTN